MRRGPKHPRAAAAAHTRFRPRLEPLECRTVPSTVTWTNAAGGAWNGAANWDAGRLPGAADDAVIGDLAAGATIAHASGFDTLRSLTSTSINAFTLSVTGGSLTLRGTFSLNANTVLSLTGNATIGGSGVLTVNGAMLWTNGTMAGHGSTTIAPGATLSIAVNQDETLDGRTLNVSAFATAVWQGDGFFRAVNSAVVNNAGTFQVQTDQPIVAGGASGAFNNAGDFQKLNRTGLTTINVPFANTGTVEVQTGTLNLAAGGRASGTFAVSAGATLGFIGSTYRLSAGSGLSGAGAVVFAGGTTEVAGTYAITGSTAITGGTATFPGTITSLGASLTISGPVFATVADFQASDVTVASATLSGGSLRGLGDLRVTGVLNWTGTEMDDTGSTTIAPGAALNIGGSAIKTLDNRTLNIAATATATWQGTGDLSLSNGAVLNNAGTFLAQNNQILGASGLTGVFNNTGTFRKSVSTGTTTVGIPFNNSGTVDVQVGTLTFDAGGTSSGTFTVENPVITGSTLIFGRGSHWLTVDASVSGPGAVIFNGGDIEIDGTYATTGSTAVTGTGGVTFLGSVNTASFSNAGALVIGPDSVFAVTGNYTQTGDFSRTDLQGGILVATAVNIQGGDWFAFGTVFGDVTNAGRLTLGQAFVPGILTINGNYTQTGTGVLNLRVGGETLGDEYDQLNITGTATLAGTLNVSLLYGFLPNVGDSFQVLTFGARSGDFATKNGLSIPPRTFATTCAAGGMTLDAS